MFCPQCRYEFKEGVTVCPDCSVPLLAELPPKPRPQPNPKLQLKPTSEPLELHKVLSICDPVILAMAKSHLEETDIPYLVKNEAIQGAYHLAFGIDAKAVEIWVRKNDAEEAMQLLQDFMEGDSPAINS